MDYERSYEYLAERLRAYLSDEELVRVQRAYELAEAAHSGQVRDEGTPYILHPLRVAISLIDELGICSPTLICAALLHDVIEDSNITREQIAEALGEDVARIVWLLTKFEDMSLADYLAAIEIESGALLVKLCDRLDNLRFLSRSPKTEKKMRYIKATERYYLPLAARTNSYIYEQFCRALEQARDHIASIEQPQG
jgi:(p)ppGpp synthase/HD superfamily hydrolase